MRRALRWVAAVAAAAAVSAVALKALPAPFCWIGVTWAVLGFVVAARAPQLARFPLVLVASVPLVFATAEAFFAITGPPDIDVQTVPALNQPDPLLGWKPKPSQVSRATGRIGDAINYEVTYTMDAAGHRVSPPDRGDKVDGCLLFFADSFTFGEGVADQETFPYQTGLKTGGRFKVVNLSVGGYGVEHMVAMMERGDLASNPPCQPTHIFYVALPNHVTRAAGKTTFSVSGPRYRLGPQGVPEYVSTTPQAKEAQAGRRGRWAEQLKKSAVHRFLTDRPKATEADIELYFALVREAYGRFARAWPKAQLHIISWEIHPFYSNGQERFRAGIKTVPAQVHYVDDILPGYTKDPLKYGLHRFDLHPNRVAHEGVATYLANRVLQPAVSAKP